VKAPGRWVHGVFEVGTTVSGEVVEAGARDRFTWSAIASSLMAHYRAMLDRVPAPRSGHEARGQTYLSIFDVHGRLVQTLRR